MAPIEQKPPISNPKVYPMMITLPDGNQIIVPNHLMHSALTGKHFDYNGQEIPSVEEPNPPANEIAEQEHEEDLKSLFTTAPFEEPKE